MRRKGSVHLAGIIPVIRRGTNFKMDWHDCLMPISPGYTALEHAVYECAMAGCHTIWIAASEDVSPLARKRIGDFVQDPVFLGRKGKYPSKDRRAVPVFYIPLKERESLVSWAILETCQKVTEISSDISKWLRPEKFYISFPQGVYDVKILRQHRQAIINEDNLLLSSQGLTVRDGEYLGFTLSEQDIDSSIEVFKEVENKYLFSEGTEIYAEDIFSLDKIFSRVIIEESEQVELPFYGCIKDWDGYCDYLSSDYSKDVRHPGELVISYREWNPIGKDNKRS
tara:strand:+ start:1044 stop:1889 length:846 start_codon:yes stop_codon:yes gene_type:complete